MSLSKTHDRTLFGFWVYIMTDCILFSSLFAAYAVLHDNTFGGPSGKEIFSLPYALGETMALLISSFTSGLGIRAAQMKERKHVLLYFLITLFFGLVFLGMEFNEFAGFAQAGHSWRQSGFLTTYFSLVGTHGLHVTVGSLWMIVLMVQVYRRDRITPNVLRRLSCLSLFWHFLDIIWIFIFTFVYLMSVL